MAFPTTTPPSLTTGQYSYNGVTLGPSTPYKVTKVTGLDLPQIRSGDSARGRDHGELVGIDLYGGRNVTASLDVSSSGSTTLAAALADLAAATEVGLTTEQPLWVAPPNLPILGTLCRIRKRSIPWDNTFMIGELVQSAALMWHSTDPFLYGTVQTATVGLGSPTTGMTFPATFPMSFGATQPNSITVPNSGNAETRPVLIITGPVTNPSIENSTVSGAPAITITNPTQTGYTVLAGDQLVVDMDLHTVLYYSGGIGSGTSGASRRNWIVYGSQWWTLGTGSNLIRFSSSDSSSVAGTLEVQWASAYII